MTKAARPIMRCAISMDGKVVTIIMGDWRTRIPSEKLADMIILYRGLRDRLGGRYAAIYAQPTEALETLAKRIGMIVPVASGKHAGKRR